MEGKEEPGVVNLEFLTVLSVTAIAVSAMNFSLVIETAWVAIWEILHFLNRIHIFIEIPDWKFV